MIYAFADLELDRGLYQLRRRDDVIKLAPKAFDLLHYLIEHRDRVVSKTELLERLWPDETVTEAVLPSNVTAIRRALGGGAARPRFIETIHGRGYRFIAPVDERQEAAVPSEELPPHLSGLGARDENGREARRDVHDPGHTPGAVRG